MATKKTQPKIESPDRKARAASTIIAPRVTEKATMHAEKNVYVFEVTSDANKYEIKKAFEVLYGKTPVKVAVTRIPSKTVVRRGKAGVKAGGKKALVYLAKGDTIELM